MLYKINMSLFKMEFRLMGKPFPHKLIPLSMFIFTFPLFIILFFWGRKGIKFSSSWIILSKTLEVLV